MIHRVRVHFSGTVQGVGFRYQVKTVASQFAVAGWVRNLSDGRVEMAAEGDRTELEALIQRIEQRMDGYISSKSVEWESIAVDAERLEGFSIAPTY